MNSRYLLDSWAILALLQKEEPAAGRVEQLFQKAAQGQISLLLSLISLGEIFYIIGRRRGTVAADKMVSYVKQLPLHIVPVDEHHVLAAARFKTKHPISYADAFAVAAAVEWEAVLVTGDPELLTLTEEVALEQLQRHSAD